MNIYLCSTVRNLLFAILKAVGEPDSECLILMVVDQQNIDVGNFDLTVLPDHIKIQFISRKSVRSELDSHVSGKLARVLAALNVKTFYFFRKCIRVYLFDRVFEGVGVDAGKAEKLFLFNDRSRLARLFRLAFAEYEIIEDGLANYYGNKLKLFESLWRKLSGHRHKKRFLGDDERCRAVFLLEPERAPEEIKYKVKPIVFIKQKNIVDYCYGFFRFQPDVGYDHDEGFILATQPISIGNVSESGFDIFIYKKIIDYLEQRGVYVLIKVHPRENPDRYRAAFPDCQILESKIPLEIMILGSSSKRNIVSIYSTAGMGFEKYCRRITLIMDEESEFMCDTFTSWEKDESLLETRISTQLQEMLVQ